MGKFVDRSGHRYGRLVALRPTPLKESSGCIKWLCQCDCGNQTIVSGSALQSGATKSCGCLHKETAYRQSYRHGMAQSRLYREWNNMKSRCNFKSGKCYSRYGGRGITYCKEWEDFVNFEKWALQNGYADNLTLDRINNDGSYTPDNCRWVTNIEQQRNKCDNHFITYRGQTKTVVEWAEAIGISSSTIIRRLRRGWSVAQALEQPSMRCDLQYRKSELRDRVKHGIER